MNKALIWLMVLTLLFVGCGPNITEGVVTNKTFEPAHDETNLEYDLLLDTVVLKTHTIPDKWFVTFGDSENKRTVEVNQSVYDSTDVGKAFNLRRTSK